MTVIASCIGVIWFHWKINHGKGEILFGRDTFIRKRSSYVPANFDDEFMSMSERVCVCGMCGLSGVERQKSVLCMRLALTVLLKCGKQSNNNLPRSSNIFIDFKTEFEHTRVCDKRHSHTQAYSRLNIFSHTPWIINFYAFDARGCKEEIPITYKYTRGTYMQRVDPRRARRSTNMIQNKNRLSQPIDSHV